MTSCRLLIHTYLECFSKKKYHCVIHKDQHHCESNTVQEGHFSVFFWPNMNSHHRVFHTTIKVMIYHTLWTLSYFDIRYLQTNRVLHFVFAAAVGAVACNGASRQVGSSTSIYLSALPSVHQFFIDHGGMIFMAEPIPYGGLLLLIDKKVTVTGRLVWG